MLGQHRRLGRRERDRLRHEQAVARDAARAALGAQALEHDPLVGRMLVDQHDASVTLAEKIAVEDLADEAQRGKSARRGRPERGLRRGGGRGARLVAGPSAAASRARSAGTISWCTAAGLRKRTSSFAGCTFTATSPGGMARKRIA